MNKIVLVVVIIFACIGGIIAGYLWMSSPEVPPINDSVPSSNSSSFNRNQQPFDHESDSEATEEDQAQDAERNLEVEEKPFIVATMTHLEGNWEAASTEKIFFDKQANYLRHAMDLADPYGVVLTFESEIPFAEGMANFDDNVFQEALDRGHGVGTHCDILPQRLKTDEELISYMERRKELIDDLVGAENNHGCSGGGGVSDWYAGATGAGFSYLNGIVGFHYMAMPMRERPDSTWTNERIASEYYHNESPADPELRFYPFFVSKASFTPDPKGDLLISAGSLGQLAIMEELEASTGVDSGLYSEDCKAGCDVTMGDIDAAIGWLEEFSAERDTTRVAKADFYLPTSVFESKNDEVLKYFFAELERLDKAGTIQLGSQLDVYRLMTE